MSPVPLNLILPRWTKRVATEGGRDPLGLSRVAFMITDYLLTGIVTTTERARYYSFYPWVLWHISQEEQPKSPQDFVDGFRRREAAMALATLAANSSASPVGIDTVRNYFASGLDEGVFDCDFRVLPSNRLGGYGQYYAGSLNKLGLIQGNDVGIDSVRPGTGDKLARLFHETIKATPYIKNRLFAEPTISKNDLMKSSEAFTLEALSESFTSDEKKCLIEMFFALDGSEIRDDARMRRQSLTLILHMISEFEEAGYPVIAERSNNGFRTDEYLLYATYFNCLWLSDDKTRRYKPPRSLKLCSDHWRQLCLHQFLCCAIEDLLCATLEAAGARNDGLPSGRIAQCVLGDEFLSILSGTVGRKVGSPRSLMTALGIKSIPNEDFSREYQGTLLPNESASEAALTGLTAISAPESAARAALMLAVLYGKWRGITKDLAFMHVAQKANAELWTNPVLLMMDSWLQEGLSWNDVLEPLIQQCVINQHERIFYEKRNLRSVWLKRSEGRIFKEQDYKPVWRNSRIFNAVHILSDLELVHFDQTNAVSVTAAGRRLMNKLLAETS